MIGISTAPQTADFGAGPVSGYIMQVQIVPEPASGLVLLWGAAVLAVAQARRRPTKESA